MSPLRAAVMQAFSASGALSRADPAYTEREVQLRMATAVADAIDTRGTLVAEAGTGVGKTFLAEQAAADDRFRLVVVGFVKLEPPGVVVGVAPEILRNAQLVVDAFAAHQHAERELRDLAAERIGEGEFLVRPEPVEFHGREAARGAGFREQGVDQAAGVGHGRLRG